LFPIWVEKGEEEDKRVRKEPESAEEKISRTDFFVLLLSEGPGGAALATFLAADSLVMCFWTAPRGSYWRQNDHFFIRAERKAMSRGDCKAYVEGLEGELEQTEEGAKVGGRLFGPPVVEHLAGGIFQHTPAHTSQSQSISRCSGESKSGRACLQEAEQELPLLAFFLLSRHTVTDVQASNRVPLLHDLCGGNGSILEQNKAERRE